MTTRQTPDTVREADPRVEVVAKALGLHRCPGGSGPINPPTRWPLDPNDKLDGRDGKVPLTWDFAEKCREDARVMLAALDSRAGDDVRPDSWTAAPEEVRERAQLLADMELHLKSSRIFITTREKMHPCGVELHDELLGRVTAAIDNIGKANSHD